MTTSDDARPRVDSVSGEFFKRGKCRVCEGSAERTKTIKAPTYKAMLTAGEKWSAEPIEHKRCEGMFVERGSM